MFSSVHQKEERQKIFLPTMKDLRVRSKLKRTREFKSAVNKQLDVYSYVNPAVQSGFIEHDPENSSNARLNQEELKKEVDIGTLKKLFDFDLEGGPFVLKPTKNGRHVIVGGKRGQLSVVDRTNMNPMCDITVDESVLDVTFLHNYTMFAAAQRKCAYIYDTISGAEIHRLKDHPMVTHLDFLPEHFLLVSWSENGIIRYLDTSTGQLVARHFSKMGPCHSLRQNDSTGVVHVGHGDGCVSLWTPSIAEPVLKIQAHYGPVSALACHDEMYVVTAGGEGRWKIWDLRKANAPLSSYSYRGAPPSSIDISQTGMIGIGNGVRVSVFNGDAFKTRVNAPYLTHHIPQGVNTARFCPFEDLLLLGKSNGIASMLVPGSGSGDFDSLGINPFETRNQRREGEVRALIEKIRPDMISLPSAVQMIGNVADKSLVEEKKAMKKSKGKSPAKRRALSETDANRPTMPTKLDRLGKINNDKSYNPLTRFG
jgi:U3 small nucleolar RNA-associated protein 7